MYEELDLRPYFTTLRQNWFWLFGAAVALAIFAYAGSQFVPPRYEATSLVIVDDQADFLQFDPRIRAEEDTQLLGAYPELAVSDAVITELLRRIESDNLTRTQLQKLITAAPGSDSRIIQLSVEGTDPETAALIANVWADELISWANLVYGAQSGESLSFYENELAAAEADLQVAENGLIEFQAVNRTSVISNTLQSLYQSQADSLAQLNSINQTAVNIANLKQFIQDSPTTTLADQLAMLRLQGEIFDASDEPYILQLSPGTDFDPTSGAQQLETLNRLAEAAAEKARIFELEVGNLEPEILRLQQEIQHSITEETRLLRNQLIAEENYLSLARKVAEERIRAQDALPPLRLISEAAVPDEPTNSNTVSTVAIAAVLGLSLGAAFVLFQHWWRSPEQDPD